MQRLEGKRAIITGAAGGIGRATALLFAAHGAKLVLADLDAAGLEQTTRLVTEASQGHEAPVVALTGDAADTHHVRQCADACIERFGTPDIFFANAGTGGAFVGLLEETVEMWQETLRINLLGPLLAVQTAAPHMAKAGQGSIILTASVAGIRSGAGPSAYSASKAGVISLAQTAAVQLASNGIRVNAICPGLIQTNMTQPIFDYATAAGKAHKLGKHNPMQRPAQPIEVATLALYLASDEASYVTGQAIPVDGGLTATHPFTPGRII